ncbi:MAG: protein of unknown function DUF551 [Bacteriophage sp.]|jgi:hypothetical protein|nr:MAG: protein of unknown function DUF551 [Bacteriophage sp.]
MSDKRKIYDYIKRTINPYGRPFEGTTYEFGLKIMDYIENMDNEKENGWIPVSKGLPEDEKECLVTLEKVYGAPETLFGIANYLKFGDAGYWNEKKYGYLEWDKYSDGHGGTKMYKVIAWKPLPEPYKEG